MHGAFADLRAVGRGQAPLQVADLYCDIQQPVAARWRQLLPGLLVVALGALAVGFVADRYGAPPTLVALLIGLALNFLSSDARLHAGLDFTARTLLRWGIVLAGLRVSYGQMATLGPMAGLAVVAIATVTIMAGLAAARLAGESRSFGLLAGGAVAICGASAALAIAATLGGRRLSREQLAVVLIGIAALSPLAMIAYPIVTSEIGFSDRQAGFLLGASIHDVAQALGAGYSVSPEAGEIATIVKLLRVALLAPLLAGMVFALRLEKGSGQPAIPWFVIGFFALAGANSLGWVPGQVTLVAGEGATALLVAAVIAIAIAAPIGRLTEAGWKPLLILAAPTLMAFAAALLAASVLVN